MSCDEFDVVVVGAGHAGCEAGAAAARLGCRVAVVTLSRSRMAEMPCNPAVGGIGKGHLVAEVDALGGIQGWASDRAGIHFKMLNASRGPAVWGPRAQCDKALYSRIVGRVLNGLAGITVIEGEVKAVCVEGDTTTGVVLGCGTKLSARAVVLTTGTFLGGVLHTGDETTAGGRIGERSSIGLGGNLENLGFELRRFKTGTPPRLHRDSIDYKKLHEQPGDEVPRPFSWRTKAVANHSLCWLTRTPSAIRQIIHDNLHRSPLFSGTIEGVGPRYCPSIEDKVVRFPHHEEHTVFLEPEGLETPSMYVNGLSTSLPADVQELVIRAIPGFADAEFLRYGYAVEYDVVAPHQVTRTLESRGVRGLFFAGQLLGTSGYEEAAAQGLVAGLNGVAWLRGEKGFVPRRETSYLGVLIDDLVSKEHREPYRMFTSRAEHRLLMGVDSARERLMEKGVEFGLVPERVFHVERDRWTRRKRVKEWLSEHTLNPDRLTKEHVREASGVEIRVSTTWGKILRNPDADVERACRRLPQLEGLDVHDRDIVLGELRYDGYRERAVRALARVEKLGGLEIPADLDLDGIPGLSREVVEEVQRAQPRTLADAERLAAMTPAAMAILAGRISRSGEDGRGDAGG